MSTSYPYYDNASVYIATALCFFVQLRTGGAGEWWWCLSRSSRDSAFGMCTDGSLPAEARANSSGLNHLANWLSPPPLLISVKREKTFYFDSPSICYCNTLVAAQYLDTRG